MTILVYFLPRDATHAECGYATVYCLMSIRPSVCPSVRPSVTFRYRDHIGWKWILRK